MSGTKHRTMRSVITIEHAKENKGEPGVHVFSKFVNEQPYAHVVNRKEDRITIEFVDTDNKTYRQIWTFDPDNVLENKEAELTFMIDAEMLNVFEI